MLDEVMTSATVTVRKRNPGSGKNRPLVSLILLDWSVRESFSTLDWLAKQDVARDQYQLIWVELYERVASEAMDKTDVVITCGQKGVYHKHAGYNAGLLHAKGQVITVCDSDAVYPPDFVRSIISSFELGAEGEPRPIVLMHYQRRTRASCSKVLTDLKELQEYEWLDLWPNVGACMSIRRRDAIQFGGFDEHRSFRSYYCGPYDLGWRLVNAGLPEIWHDESVCSYHFAHPHSDHAESKKERSIRDIIYPHMDWHALKAVEALSSGRLLPLKENREIHQLRLANRTIGTSFEEKYAKLADAEGSIGGLVRKARALLLRKRCKECWRDVSRGVRKGRLFISGLFLRTLKTVVGQRIYDVLRGKWHSLRGGQGSFATEGRTPVLYLGYLPVFLSVGTHPQFVHMDTPPDGYEFVRTDLISSIDVPRPVRWVVKLLRSVRLVWPTVTLMWSAMRNGGKFGDVLNFVGTRGGVRMQAAVPAGVDLAFVPSRPHILCQVPWVIEIEDVVSLFYPFIVNGETASVDIVAEPCYPMVKAMLESPSCKGIITHVKSTAESIPVLFRNKGLQDKVTYIPLGVGRPAKTRRRSRKKDGAVRVLFTNSWHQGSDGFYLRGGLDVLEAFSIISPRYPNAELVLRTQLPPDLDERYTRMIEQNKNVEVIDEFLPVDDLEGLMLKTDIYVIPSARIHVVSLLKAMAFRIAVVVSDGWGFEEYVEHRRNGLVVKGRYGKCSWLDSADGMLKEDYRPLRTADTTIAKGLADELTALIDDPELRETLAQNARTDVETKFSVDSWNEGLKSAFDRALER